MDTIRIGVLVFALTCGGALAAMKLRAWLPDHHLRDESKETVLMTIGLLVTMTALLLGFMTTSAMSSFDAVSASVKTTAVDLISLDRLLDQYGLETREIRRALKSAVADRIDAFWPGEASHSAHRDHPDAVSGVEQLAAQIRHLTPQTADQRWLQARAIVLSDSLLDLRWGILAGNESSFRVPFLTMLMSCLTLIFVTFGLFAPRNGTVVSALVTCALAVTGAVFLILEMNRPFGGLIRVSAEPMKYALAHLSP